MNESELNEAVRQVSVRELIKECLLAEAARLSAVAYSLPTEGYPKDPAEVQLMLRGLLAKARQP